MSPAASSCPATASRASSMRGARSSRSRRSPPADMYGGEAPGAGVIAGHRARARPSRDGGLQRRDREGRHLLPAHGEEAPARAGDRAREPPALRLPRRLRRRVPADAGRGLPRSRPLRPHLLQPGADVGGGRPADRRGARLVHGRRRLRPRDERRDGDRARPGHDLPRRTAAREGRDRRDRHRGGARRRRPARPPLGRRRPPRRGRRARARDRARHRRDPAAAARARVGCAAARRRPPSIPPTSTASSRST